MNRARSIGLMSANPEEATGIPKLIPTSAHPISCGTWTMDK